MRDEQGVQGSCVPPVVGSVKGQVEWGLERCDPSEGCVCPGKGGRLDQMILKVTSDPILSVVFRRVLLGFFICSTVVCIKQQLACCLWVVFQ